MGEKKKWKCHQFVNKTLNFATVLGAKGGTVGKNYPQFGNMAKKYSMPSISYGTMAVTRIVWGIY